MVVDAGVVLAALEVLIQRVELRQQQPHRQQRRRNHSILSRCVHRSAAISITTTRSFQSLTSSRSILTFI